jgi:hypothetical protein
VTPFEEECVEALTDLIENMRETGSIVHSDGKPYHRVGCTCGICAGVRLVAFAEGGGRCILCGCTDDHACDVGCGWTSPSNYVCTAHPRSAIRAAERLVAKRAKEVGRRG